ncbi:MAG: hypothetical protein DCE90_07575 [Pseudanabaena sp.]|nr:MAG: hypothetical protein DCE90_07575 [Pseudanabaena sp.]
MKNSLSRQLLGGFAMSLVVVGSSTLWINFQLLQKDLRGQVEKRAQSIARGLEFGTEGLIEYGNINILKRMVQNYETLPTVIEIDIIAPDNNSIITDTINGSNQKMRYREAHPELIPYFDESAKNGLELKVETVINNKPALIHILPFSSSLFRNIDPKYTNKRGLVIVAVDLEEIRKDIWGIFITTTMMMVGGTSAILVLMIVLTHIYALNPLKILTTAISQSKTTGSIDLKKSLPSNEINYLAETLIKAIAQIHEFENSKNEELRQINQELEQLSESLEMKVIDRTIELTNMNAELKQAQENALQASKAKSLFLANMSHELRTPLNAILGFTQLILETSDVSEESREQLQIINHSGEHLLNLINNILVISRIESAKQELNLEIFDINNLLTWVREIVEVKSRDKGISLVVENQLDDNILIQTDELKLRQILINLLSNAIKFTLEGGVYLRVFMDSKDFQPDIYLTPDGNQQYLYFEIKDTGIGIAPEDIENIFQPFFQSKSEYGYREGTGLGLSISKQFVNLMGGDITVSSSLGSGTTFKFYVLVNTINSESSLIPTETLADLQINNRFIPEMQNPFTQLNILLAEDNKFNQMITLKMLEHLGHNADVVNDGLEVLEKLKHQDYDIILMDIQMPRMDGIEATRRVLNDGFYSRKPLIIALTASVMQEDKEICLSAGMYRFVSKPVKIDILQSILKEASEQISTT